MVQVHAERVEVSPEGAADHEVLRAGVAGAVALLDGRRRELLEILGGVDAVRIPEVAVTVPPAASPRQAQALVARQVAAALARWIDEQAAPLLAVHEQLSSAIARGRDLGTRISRVIGKIPIAKLAQKKAHGFVDWFRPIREAQFAQTEETLREADHARDEVREVVDQTLQDSPERMAREPAHRLVRGLGGYGLRYGIRVKHEFGLPSLEPDPHDFTSITSKSLGFAYKDAVVHEAVHVLHMVQARTTAVKQVLALEGKRRGSARDLGPEGLREVQARVGAFERSANYPELEKFATSTGGAGGKVPFSQQEYKQRLLAGSRQLADAFKNATLRFRYEGAISAADRKAVRKAEVAGKYMGEGFDEALFNVLAPGLAGNALAAALLGGGIASGLVGVLAGAALYNLLRQREVGNAVTQGVVGVPARLLRWLRRT